MIRTSSDTFLNYSCLTNPLTGKAMYLGKTRLTSLFDNHIKRILVVYLIIKVVNIISSKIIVPITSTLEFQLDYKI